MHRHPRGPVLAWLTIAGGTTRSPTSGCGCSRRASALRGRGFPDYQIEIPFRGKPLTKTAQIELAGNSVCPDVARELVEANGAARAAEVVA